MANSTLTSKGQVTVPKPIRDRLGLRPGDRLEFNVQPDGTMMVEPLGPEGKRRPLEGYLNDRLRVAGSFTLEELDSSMRKHVADNVIAGLRKPGMGGSGGPPG